ncbi:MAG: helix-turn-helix domain-containing protein [Chloroflexota bacterium]
MPRSPSDWITLAEAAEMLDAANVRVRPATIGAWARRGQLQTIKLAGRRYVRRGEVRRLLAPRQRVAVDTVQAALFEDLQG